MIDDDNDDQIGTEWDNEYLHLSVPGGATIVTQMRANGVQQERKKKEKIERR